MRDPARRANGDGDRNIISRDVDFDRDVDELPTVPSSSREEEYGDRPPTAGKPAASSSQECERPPITGNLAASSSSTPNAVDGDLASAEFSDDPESTELAPVSAREVRQRVLDRHQRKSTSYKGDQVGGNAQ